MAALPMPSESRIAFCVKNTFVDALSDDERAADDQQPTRAPRSLTAPVAAASDCGSASCSEVSTLDYHQAASSSEASALEHNQETVDTDCGANCDSALPVLMGGRGRLSLAKVPEADLLPIITIKNTFVDLAEQSPSTGKAERPGCMTAPVRSGRFSPRSPSTATPPAEDAVPSTPSPWAAADSDPSGGAFVPCSTPTPWGTGSAELGFCTLAGAPPAPPAAPRMPEVAPRKPWGKITAASEDKSIAVRQAGDSCVVQWTVESRNLRGNAKQLVSGPFEVTLREGAAPTVFKMMLCGQKGGLETSFQRAGGMGAMCLKCCSDVPDEAHGTTDVRFSVGGGGVAQAPRGPVSHQFHSSSVCTLPKDRSTWDFGASSYGSSTFTLSVELSHAGLARPHP